MGKRFVIEFDSAEELVAFSTAQGGEVTAPAPKLLVSNLPQSIQVKAAPGHLDDGRDCIVLTLLHRGSEDEGPNVITLKPGDSQVV